MKANIHTKFWDENMLKHGNNPVAIIDKQNVVYQQWNIIQLLKEIKYTQQTRNKRKVPQSDKEHMRHQDWRRDG
jgi:hypothetical protein